MPQYFRRKTENILNPPLLMLCIVFIAIGLIIIVTQNEMEGLVFIIPGALFLLLHRGTIIDFKNRKIKKYWGFPLINFGEWKNIENVESLIIFSSTKTTEYNLPYGGAQSFSKTATIKLTLKKTNKEQILLSQGKYESVLRDANLIASELRIINIVDLPSKAKANKTVR